MSFFLYYTIGEVCVTGVGLEEFETMEKLKERVREIKREESSVEIQVIEGEERCKGARWNDY